VGGWQRAAHTSGWLAEDAIRSAGDNAIRLAVLYHAEGGMMMLGRPGLDWTVVLRRQPARLVAGEPEGGYTDMFEIICCDCGDDPDLDYREVSPEIRRIRGPYPIVTGIAAYKRHLKQHPAHGPHFLARTSR
jgi:hypothetical protein